MLPVPAAAHTSGGGAIVLSSERRRRRLRGRNRRIRSRCAFRDRILSQHVAGTTGHRRSEQHGTDAEENTTCTRDHPRSEEHRTDSRSLRTTHSVRHDSHDTRFRNIVKPAGVIRPIEAIAHNLRSSSIKFSTIGLSGGSSSSSSQAATWLNNYVKNRKSSFGTREIPTVVAALCKDATALCSNVYIELGRMFSWMCDRKIISASQSQTFSSAAYACRVTNTSGGGGGGGGGAPGGNILTRACKNNPDRLEILNVVFGAAELYGGMNYNLTETIDREYERDADMSTVMVGASLRLYVGTSARRLGRSVTGKTTTMTAASGDPAGGGGGGGIGGNGGGGGGDPSTATVDRGQMKMIRSSTTYLDTGMLPRRNKRRRRQTGGGRG